MSKLCYSLNTPDFVTRRFQSEGWQSEFNRQSESFPSEGTWTFKRVPGSEISFYVGANAMFDFSKANSNDFSETERLFAFVAADALDEMLFGSDEEEEEEEEEDA